MKIKITAKPHPHIYLRKQGYNTVFTILDSIHKTHFKALMKLGWQYDSTTKSAYCEDANLPALHALAERIEKANDKTARASHAKSIAKCKERKGRMSFSEWLEEADMPERDENGNWFDLETGLYFDDSVIKKKAAKVELEEQKSAKIINTVVEDKSAEIFSYLNEKDFEIEKGENDRYFLIKNGNTEGEIMNVLNHLKIQVRFDKNEFGTTLSIAERSEIHSAISDIQK